MEISHFQGSTASWFVVRSRPLKAVPGPTCSYYAGADFAALSHTYSGVSERSAIIGAHILPRKEADLDDDGPTVEFISSGELLPLQL